MPTGRASAGRSSTWRFASPISRRRVRLCRTAPATSSRSARASAFVELHEGDPNDSGRPLLNHVAVLVDSADEHTSEAERLGIVDRVVDAANTRAVFVWGPDRVRIEYVEHKPGFALN